MWTGTNGMSQLMRALGADELGGTIQIGLMPHSTIAEIDQLVDVLSALVHGSVPLRR